MDSHSDDPDISSIERKVLLAAVRVRMGVEQDRSEDTILKRLKPAERMEGRRAIEAMIRRGSIQVYRAHNYKFSVQGERLAHRLVREETERSYSDLNMSRTRYGRSQPRERR